MFFTDKQTLEDLNIPGKYRANSVFSLFNNTITKGGERLLEELFRKPLTDPSAINKRTAVFKYFVSHPERLPFTPERFSAVEEYLSSRGASSLAGTAIDIVKRKILAISVKDNGYEQLHEQVLKTVELLQSIHSFLEKYDDLEDDGYWIKKIIGTKKIFLDIRLAGPLKMERDVKLTMLQLIRLDHLLRSVLDAPMKDLLDAIYHLDICISVSEVARMKNCCFADALISEKNSIEIRQLKHPCLERAIGNNIRICQDSNVVFLTGANMAGKSTFMKSFGIAIYLAHMGFPVAADEMNFSVRDGLYTSINVSDNLSMGYSHFYAEVLRVKKVAEEIQKRLNLVIVFDELFKGTNVKDAYDATVAITAAFAEKQNCSFIISTHITEAGQDLTTKFDNLQFVYFPSILQGVNPVYTYQLEKGISNDKHGMVILRKEGVFELLGGG